MPRVWRRLWRGPLARLWGGDVAERLFIDLLPDTWTGLAPGLPKDVIEQLSRRARDAERALRSQRQVGAKSERSARVRVATQPSFTRYVFELPEVVPVTSDRGALIHARLVRDLPDVSLTLIGRCAEATVTAMHDIAGEAADRITIDGINAHVPFARILDAYRAGGWLCGLAVFPSTRCERRT